MTRGRRGTTGAMTTQLTVDVDAEQARNAVGTLSVVLGSAAVLAPVRTARLLGVKGAGVGDGPLFVRMIGARNATMGLRTLQATGEEQARAVQAGLVVGAVDAVAVLLAARRGSITKKAAAGALLLLGAIAAGGVLASRD